MPLFRRGIYRAAIGLTFGLALAAPLAAGSELAQPPASYPPCTSFSLAGFPWTHQAFGRSIPGIGLRNMTLAACRVAGFPQVRAYEYMGRRANIRIVRHMFADTKIYAYTVMPGSAVFFALYGDPPHGEYDRSCVGIGQIDVVLPGDRRAIDITVTTGTCGGRLTVSQMFPVSELFR